MVAKKTILLFFVLLLSYSIIAEDLNCQYEEFETQNIEKLRLVNEETGEIWGEPLIFSDFVNGPGGKNEADCIAGFTVSNSNNKAINGTIKFLYKWRTLMKEANRDVTTPLIIGPKEIVVITESVSSCHRYAKIDPDSISYVLYGNIKPILKFEEIQIEVCQSCNGDTCVDDGDSCSKSSECGGGFCIEGHCSNNELCFDNNCKCNDDQIQCGNNQCVGKYSLEIGSTPICKAEECKTSYVNKESGECDRKPLPVWFYLVLIGGLIILTIVSLVIYENTKRKHEEARQKTLQKQTELVITKLNTKNAELEKIKHEIEQIQIQKKEHKEELSKLNELKQEKESLSNEIDDMEKEIDHKWDNLRPFPDKQAKGRLVIINPYLGGYKCFYKKDVELKDYRYSSLVHRWVWKKHNGRHPRHGYHIHHIDEDKYNNDVRNLEEIKGEEHYKIHRNS
jgi:hypothetical protein